MEASGTKLGIVRSWMQRGLAAVHASYVMALVAGCTAEVETARPVVVADDAELVEVQTAPADVYAYPRTEYRGHPVYYVNGHWYYPQGRRWYYYRTEPTELTRHRRYVEQAPPAPRPYYPPPGDAVRVQ